MRATWLYYDYLRRYGVLIVLGLVIGASLGFGYNQTQPKRPIYVAQATIAESPYAGFFMFTKEHGEPQAAVDDILNTVKRLGSAAALDYEVKDIKISSRYRNVLWKTMVMGSVVGCLVAIGVGYVWDDVMTYQRRRKEGESDV